MADLATLISSEIPEGRHNLSDSHTNLERVAEYCEGNYFQAENKRVALEETKNYTTQSLASVAYQINTLAYNFLQMLDLQAMQLAEMESQMNHIAQTVMIHKEKVARREIGILTANKTITRQYKILAPSNPEKPIKYVRKPIDYSALDDIGHGVKTASSTTPRQKRGSSQGSVQGLVLQPSSVIQSVVGPAPTTKPPTPPQPVRVGGSLSKGSREYRTPPAVAPPQVPSHYAPNYPLGHPRRGERGSGYSTLPLPHSHAPTSPPQVGMVHPIPHGQLQQAPHPQTPPPPPPTAHNCDQLGSMPPPPSPLPMSGMSAVDFEMHHPGNSSPPLPPPPPDGEHHGFGAGDRTGQTRQPGIMPVEEDLPGWVPKNYIEKVVAIYDYYADKDDELSFQENAVIYVLKKNDDGWWEGVMDGITGLFPGNYVEPCV